MDHTGELVAGNARKPGVAAQQLQIGPANPGGRDTNQALARSRGHGSIPKCQGSGIQNNRAHRRCRDAAYQVAEKASNLKSQGRRQESEERIPAGVLMFCAFCL
jgi:hypothetical protein